MDPVGLVLVVVGLIAVAFGVYRARAPLAMIRHLDATAANLRRYEDWRGKRNSIDADGPTGADVMRDQMRQRLILWGILAAAGGVAVVVGLVLA